MPTITQIEYLLAVDAERHFGRAAKRCHVTQPTLSTAIANLEDELDTPLFDRNVQPVLPTVLGIAIIEQARTVHHEMQRLKALAKSGKDEISGPYSLGIIPTVSPYLLPLFLDSFLKSYPKVSLDIKELTTAQIIEHLHHEAIDCGLLAIPVDAPQLTSESLYVEPFYLYVHQSHNYAKKKQIDVRDIDGQDLWLLQEGHCFRNQVLHACKIKTKSDPKTAKFKFESGSLETLMRLVDQGVGYTLVPQLSIPPESARNEHSNIVRFANPVPARNIGLITRRTTLKQKITNALSRTIKSTLPASLPREEKNLNTIPVIDTPK
jgi:LysR family transcriptional regulator, hydrogen peroxide-inducible genes activator